MLLADLNSTVPATARNEVVRALRPGDFSLLRPHLSRVRLVQGQILHEAGERIEHAYFVEQGIVSMVSEADRAGPGATPGMTEVGMVGREGLVGLTVLLQADTIAYSRAIVQVAGTAFRIPAPILRRLAVEVPLLQQALFRALQVLMSTTAQTAACNSRHALPERLARWLLIAHDRVDGDELLLLVLRVAGEVHDEQLHVERDLRGGQPEPLAGVHELEHLPGRELHVLVDGGHGLERRPEGRVRVLHDLHRACFSGRETRDRDGKVYQNRHERWVGWRSR